MELGVFPVSVFVTVPDDNVWVGLEQLELKPQTDSNWNWIVGREQVAVPIGTIAWLAGAPNDADEVSLFEDGEEDVAALVLDELHYNDKGDHMRYWPLCQLPGGRHY